MAEEEQPEDKPARKPPARSAPRTRKPRQASRDANHDDGRDPERNTDHDGRHDASHDGHGAPSRRRQHGEGHLNAVRAARLGLRQVAELTGKEPAGVASVERSEDGWTVGVEVIEDRRIPSSTDVLALYQADLAGDGELVGYRRIRRYKRGQGDTEYGGESW